MACLATDQRSTRTILQPESTAPLLLNSCSPAVCGYPRFQREDPAGAGGRPLSREIRDISLPDRRRAQYRNGYRECQIAAVAGGRGDRGDGGEVLVNSGGCAAPPLRRPPGCHSLLEGGRSPSRPLPLDPPVPGRSVRPRARHTVSRRLRASGQHPPGVGSPGGAGVWCQPPCWAVWFLGRVLRASICRRRRSRRAVRATPPPGCQRRRCRPTGL